MSNVIFIFSSIFISYIQIFVWSIFFGEKINFKRIWFYISLFLITCLGLANYFYVNAFLRIVIVVILFCFCCFLIFGRKLNEVITNVIFSQFLLTLCDVLSALFVLIFFKLQISAIREDIFLTACGNFLTSFIFVIICKISYTRFFYSKLLMLISKIRVKNFFVVCVLITLSLNFLMATIYYELNFVIIFLINSCLIIIYSFIIYRSLSEKNNSIMVKAENDSLMNSLSQYEAMVDRQRVDNHENKNQLLIIKNMIKKDDKDVVKYIDTVIKDKKEDDEALYTRVKTIPSGGLQGIIYQKMLVMKDEKILFSLDVSRDVRKINLDNLNMEDNYRLCKIIGVFLDNAIEESKRVDDKRIMISLYVDDDYFVIDISNKFSGNVDLEKIDDEGYTTKGEGHGYGLSLVKKILSETNIFENERSIKKNVFKQVIKVKIKNT